MKKQHSEATRPTNMAAPQQGVLRRPDGNPVQKHSQQQHQDGTEPAAVQETDVLRLIELRNRVADVQFSLEVLAEQILRHMGTPDSSSLRAGPHVLTVRRELAGDTRLITLLVNGAPVFRRETLSVPQPWGLR